ncbi:NAD(P)-binding protein [Rhizodiscina lignyota]|uniref:NAD(P)-binding protein n=1 Tax=Rhizodiscina lignyota TaxID=1504668 RepID=A0A9P4IEN9_9PEZI|nr:NAD(P)-binding protein [Rhizodiscina lignyota]
MNGNIWDRFSLNGRSIIVTGAVGGMGVQVVRGILEAGGDVVCIDRVEIPNASDWERSEAIASSSGSKLSYYKCDVSDVEGTYTVFEAALSQARYPLRGLVTCAGIGWVGPSISFPIDEARRIVEVNLLGTLICAQAAARLVFKNQFSASFVFIASMSGYIVNKGSPNTAYAVSKAGVHQITRNLASEWAFSKDAPSIRVNSISPGVIRTPMTSKELAKSDLERIWTEESMLKRLSDPEDYQGPVNFLLSDASAYVTAADLRVDGGYTAW